jgi:hypothetical protein
MVSALKLLLLLLINIIILIFIILLFVIPCAESLIGLLAVDAAH